VGRRFDLRLYLVPVGTGRPYRADLAPGEGSSFGLCESARLVETLRRRRIDEDVSQERVGERMGVSLQSISRWERHSYYPRPLVVIAWSTALGCEPELWPDTDMGTGGGGSG
jgi:DNA-binding XRE family transcriptional regulator